MIRRDNTLSKKILEETSEEVRVGIRKMMLCPYFCNGDECNKNGEIVSCDPYLCSE